MWLAWELKYALRGVRRAPAFSIAFILTLGLGIGVNAAIFSVVTGVFLRPLPNQEENRLVYLQQSAPGIGMDDVPFSVPEIEDYRARVRSIVGFGEFSQMRFTTLGLGEPRQVRAGLVDGQYFEVMGLQAVRGRLIGPADDQPGSGGVIVLTHGFWTTALGGDPAVVGRQVRLSGRGATVIGVLEPAPPYPAETEIFANVVTSPHHLSALMTTDREHRMTNLFGRLAPGATIESVRTELRTVQGAMAVENPAAYAAGAHYSIDATLLRDQINVKARTTMAIIVATAVLVLSIACLNIANLLLARALRRQHEFSVRAALGARPGMLRLMLLLECLVLAVAGAGLGALVAVPGVRVLSSYIARFSIRATEISLDAAALWFALGVALAAATAFTLVPELPTLSSGGDFVGARGVGQSRRTRRSQRALAVGQVTVSFVLLVGAGLLLRTLLALRASDPGFDTQNLLVVSVPVISGGRTPDEVRRTYEELERRLDGLPGVRSAALASAIPLRDGAGLFGKIEFSAEGTTDDRADDSPRANFRSVSPGFFTTLGIPILAGRAFTDGDRADADDVVIVSQSVVNRAFAGRDPIGRRISWTDDRMRFAEISQEGRRIIGVVADIREDGLDRPPAMTIYHPFAQEPAGARVFIRAINDADALVTPVRKAIREVAADQPIDLARTMDEIRTDVVAPSRVNAILIGSFALVALAIASVGIAGVLGYAVSTRLREYGIRMAIGSTPGHILVSVLREGVGIAGAGIALGLVGALGMSRIVAGVLYGTAPLDPTSFGVAALLLALATIVSAFAPAVRAARIDPVTALQSE